MLNENAVSKRGYSLTEPRVVVAWGQLLDWLWERLRKSIKLSAVFTSCFASAGRVGKRPDTYSGHDSRVVLTWCRGIL